jgi:hypothetical protein
MLDNVVSSLGRSEEENFFRNRVQTGSVTHTASYPVGSGDSSLGVKRPLRKADHSLLSSAEIKNVWSFTFIPQNVVLN